MCVCVLIQAVVDGVLPSSTTSSMTTTTLLLFLGFLVCTYACAFACVCLIQCILLIQRREAKRSHLAPLQSEVERERETDRQMIVIEAKCQPTKCVCVCGCGVRKLGLESSEIGISIFSQSCSL